MGYAPERAERLGVGNLGWCRYTSTGLPDTSIYLRFVDQSGRLEVADLFVATDAVGRNVAAMLRAIPLGRLEAWVNGDMADDVRRGLNTPGPDLRTAASYYRTTFGTERNWVRAMFEGGVEPAKQRPMRVARWEPPKPLEKPSGRPYPDRFYVEVADAYRAWAQVTHRPVAAIADANHVPSTTAQRWVRVTRERGLLPPPHQGKAG